MQSISGFTPVTQSIGSNARASVANKSRNLFAGGQTDSFQRSQQAVKFAGLWPAEEGETLKGDALKKAILSADNLNSKIVHDARTGKPYKATGWQHEQLMYVRKDPNLTDSQKMENIRRIFADSFSRRRF